MKGLFIATAAVALSIAVNPAPVRATEPPVAGGAVAAVWQGNGASIASRQPHYEWQYHYAGRHPRLVGHWVWVE